MANVWTLCGLSYHLASRERVGDALLRTFDVEQMNLNRAVLDLKEPPYQWDLIAQAATFRDYFRNFHYSGLPRTEAFEEMDIWLARASAEPLLERVQCPFLCITARDDPLVPLDFVPTSAFTHSSNAVLAVTPSGGHHIYLSWAFLFESSAWVDRAAVEFLQRALAECTKNDD